MLQNITEHCKYYRVFQSITDFYRVLQSITDYYRVLQSITEYYRSLQSITEYYRVLQSITEYYGVFLAHLLGPISGLVSFGSVMKHKTQQTNPKIKKPSQLNRAIN